MSEIPEDIMKKARRVYDALGRGSILDIERIARVIMEAKAEERERCAQIAERMLVFADTTSSSDKAIASAIRNEGAAA